MEDAVRARRSSRLNFNYAGDAGKDLIVSFLVASFNQRAALVKILIS